MLYEFNIRYSDKSDLKNANYLGKLINKVYAQAEDGMWKPGIERINIEQVQTILQNEAFIFAEKNHLIIGCVNIHLFNQNVAGFGLLVAHPEYRNIGIGRQLVKAAEMWATSNQRSIMRLELLTPKNWKQPSKEFLHSWYIRIGYQPHCTEPFEEAFPDKVNFLTTPCNFTVYHKKLFSVSS